MVTTGSCFSGFQFKKCEIDYGQIDELISVKAEAGLVVTFDSPHSCSNGTAFWAIVVSVA